MARRSTVEQLLLPHVAACQATLAAALAGDVTAVHQTRVASRRLREVVPVVGAGSREADRARRAVRRITRALGPVRELDVSLAVYADLVVDPPLRPSADVALRQMISRAHALAQRRARASLTSHRLQRVWSAVDALALVPGPSRHEGRRLADSRVRRRARRVSDSLEHMGLLYAPERLHAVRIAVKQLRYALEAAGQLRSRPTATALRDLRAVQDLLGRAHDLHMLGGLVQRAASSVVARSRAAARDLDRLGRLVEERCRECHAAFLRRRRALAALARSLAVPSPLVPVARAA